MCWCGPTKNWRSHEFSHDPPGAPQKTKSCPTQIWRANGRWGAEASESCVSYINNVECENRNSWGALALVGVVLVPVTCSFASRALDDRPKLTIKFPIIFRIATERKSGAATDTFRQVTTLGGGDAWWTAAEELCRFSRSLSFSPLGLIPRAPLPPRPLLCTCKDGETAQSITEATLAPLFLHPLPASGVAVTMMVVGQDYSLDAPVSPDYLPNHSW